MNPIHPEAIVAGHLCLDIIPQFPNTAADYRQALQPGKLVFVDQPVMGTGGAVSNTGIALHRLGIRTALMGKVGDDLFGHAIMDIVRAESPLLAAGMIVDPAAVSSYTVVINPPGLDRMFLHCPGANDTFTAADVRYDQLAGARLFHYGYPPLMRQFYIDGGVELSTMYRRVKERGLTTSLDMAMPDPHSDAGRAPWRKILELTLPYVDIFLPSFDEMLQMLGRAAAAPTRVALRALAEELQALGPAIVGFKLGDQGLYVRRGTEEILAPCFQAKVVGTTGSGDCTIAGFLAAWLKGLSLEAMATTAVAVGACNVEAADALSGIVGWDAVQARIKAGWQRLPSRVS